ncbi:MAG: glutamate synthase central domain-containing protein, partial [Bacteriovoracaceae bacterium]
MLKTHSESSHCGVGFLVDLEGERCFDLLSSGLECLEKLEHRGGTGNHPLSGDGAGILTSIPYELFARDPETFALGQIFCHPDEKLWEQGLKKVTEVFNSYGLFIDEVREVETDRSALAPEAQDCAPKVRQLFIKRPIHCRTHSSFERLLYTAKQMVKCVLNQEGLSESLEFVSLSSRTVVYKVLGQSKQVRQFYKDLQNPQFKTSYVLFHRRFTTNSLSSWDKVQPFSLIAHNGEINAFQGNRSWAITREKALGLRKDELITHEGVSDTSNLNEMVEALRYRSSIPSEAEILSILIPPAVKNNDFYKFWARAVEPWDGPALVAYCSGKMIGARLDRNGFRPCRWMRTKKYFYLGSESGTFLPPDEVLESGALKAGESLKINLFNGKMYFEDPSLSQFNTGAEFDPRCNPLDYVSIEKLNKNVPRSFGFEATPRENWPLYGVHKELLTKLVFPMIEQGSEPVGSMGDTAKPAFLSDLNRNFYDYFYQRFAQVTNPPLDYLREKRVTDLTVFIGRKPNIFEPKELIPLKETIELSGPVLSLGQMEKIKTDEMYQDYRPAVISTLINPCETKEELLKQIDQLFDIALEKVRRGCQILILSDRGASPSKWIIPGLIAMKAVHQKLNQSGLRLRTSVVLDSGEIFTPHQLSVLIGFGATAVCPYLYLEMARLENLKKTDGMFPDEKEKRAIRAMEKGLLRVMAKMGISVLRSYQGAELFDVVGLGSDILDEFFPNRESIVGGLTFTGLIQNLKNQNQIGDLKNYFYFKESPKGTGEGHSITTKKTKEIHKWLKENDEDGLPWKEWEN